ncbi:MAG: branched-chain amino acid transport system ATP-binding protein [Pseudonocardiales bacterium]|jgi:branched-chain amino acid transport system ATP-binding protein|nr:branched-chain amino acid transport system ATP-binding protein [Pseudonocardiales bacterium]
MTSVAGAAPQSDAVVLPPLVPVLQAAGVVVRFGGVVALDGVDATLGRGEVLGLIGPNGAGKTTLFDVIAGSRRPARGAVTLNGTDITRRGDLWRARSGIRRTFQRQQLFNELTVEENVLVALEWHRGGGGLAADLLASPARRATERARRQRVADTLELCGLSDSRHRAVGSLPIGAGRFVELARALVDDPQVLLLDEPRSGLGDVDSDRLASLLRRVRAERECSILLVEHDMAFVMGICDRILVLHLGQVLAEGDPETVQSNELVRRAYLG